MVRFIAKNFYISGNRREIKILEIGCGPGANLWYMAREGFSVYGIDGSETAVKKACRRLNEEIPGWTGQVVVGDIVSLPFEENYFDAVIDVEAISCNSFDNSRKSYDELFRVTKQGGKLFSRTFATGSWGDGRGKHVGHNAWIVDEGPLLGKGYTRFTDFDEIEELIKPFISKEVEMLRRTMENRSELIKEWIIIGEKL